MNLAGCTGQPTTKKSVQPSQSAQDQPSQQEQVSQLKFIAGTVTKVVDGDTVYIKLSTGQEEKVRFIGVDTPESTIQHESYGERASNYTRNALNGKKVYLELDVGQRDKYGRLLAYIWLSQPQDVNDTQIRKKQFNARLLLDGYAQLMTVPPNVKYVEYYTKYQTEAREANRGLWGLESSITNSDGSTNPTPSNTPLLLPSKSKQEVIVYITNTGSKYHRDGCRYLSKSQIPISLSDAKARGYEPCKVCNPPY